jgi:hypothetical protein
MRRERMVDTRPQTICHVRNHANPRLPPWDAFAPVRAGANASGGGKHWLPGRNVGESEEIFAGRSPEAVAADIVFGWRAKRMPQSQ